MFKINYLEIIKLVAAGTYDCTIALFKLFWPVLLLIFFAQILITFIRHYFGDLDSDNEFSNKSLRHKKYSIAKRREEDTYIDKNGYLRFCSDNLLVSRWVVEEKLGRKLYSEEVVHHINRNKLDNHPSNLWVFANQEEHSAIHEKDGDFVNDYYDEADSI